MEDARVFSYIGKAIQHDFQNIMKDLLTKDTGNYIGAFALAF